MKRGWILAEMLFIAGSASAQVARPAFDVTSIKLNTRCDTGGGRGGGASTPGRLAIECADLRDLILTAYGIYGNGADPLQEASECRSSVARRGWIRRATTSSRNQPAIRLARRCTDL